jgi:hypothetical protein
MTVLTVKVHLSTLSSIQGRSRTPLSVLFWEEDLNILMGKAPAVHMALT